MGHELNPNHQSPLMPGQTAAASDSATLRPRELLRRATGALEAAEHGGQPHAISQGHAGMAAAYAALGAWPSAEAHLGAAVHWARCGGANDPVVALLCELAETCANAAEAQRANGDAAASRAARERARDAAFEASQLAARVADPDWEAPVLLRISDVLDRCGDRDDAVVLQTRALRLMSGAALAEPADPHRMPGLGRLADS